MSSNALRAVSLLVSLLGLPIWMYFIYRVLNIIQADELTWFLFWMYIPLIFVITVLSKLVDWGNE